jgi:hypothetical protein
MGTHYVFRIEDTKNKGMRMIYSLYETIVLTTAHHSEEGKFPQLLAGNTYKGRKIGAARVPDFKEELSGAGEIVLAHRLLGYDPRNDQVVILERNHTAPEAAVHLATLIELCDDCISQNKGLSVRKEDSSPDHRRLSLEKEVDLRISNWLYLAGAKTVFHYKTMIQPSK